MSKGVAVPLSSDLCHKPSPPPEPPPHSNHFYFPINPVPVCQCSSAYSEDDVNHSYFDVPVTLHNPSPIHASSSSTNASPYHVNIYCDREAIEIMHFALDTPSDPTLPPPPTSEWSSLSTCDYFPFDQ